MRSAVTRHSRPAESYQNSGNEAGWGRSLGCRLRRSTAAPKSLKESNMKRKMWVVLILAGALLACKTRTYSNDENWDRCKGDDASASVAACTALIEAGKETKTNLAKLYYSRGRAHRHQGKYDLALEDYDHAIEINPDYALAFNNRGLVYNDKHEYDLAIADYEHALTLDPRLAMSMNNRCLAYYLKSDYDRALQDCEQALKMDPHDANPYYNRGLIKRKKGDKAGGDADIARARQMNPDVAR
jgi:tetratricopeptide (TPR) repeat protein